VSKLCNGVQIHTEGPEYDHHAFRPWRMVALAFKAIRQLYPDYPLWRDFAYEYEHGKQAIDVINGGPKLREWVDDAEAAPQDLDALAAPDEESWLRERAVFDLLNSVAAHAPSAIWRRYSWLSNQPSDDFIFMSSSSPTLPTRRP